MSRRGSPSGFAGRPGTPVTPGTPQKRDWSASSTPGAGASDVGTPSSSGEPSWRIIEEGVSKRRGGGTSGTASPASLAGSGAGGRLIRWEFVRGIGTGQFGSVVVVRRKRPGETVSGRSTGPSTPQNTIPQKRKPDLYAMKCIDKYTVWSKGAVQRTLQELRILSRVSHPNVLRSIAAFQDTTNLYLVTELCAGGSIETLLRRRTRLDVESARFVTAQLVLALSHIHSIGVVHMDVKPENCLLDARGRLRLADFNAAAIWGTSKVAAGLAPRSVAGTPGFLAPEVLERTRGYPVVAPDWWSVGVSLYRMLHGRGTLPFSIRRRPGGALLSWSQMAKTIRATPTPQIDSKLPAAARDLLLRLLQVDPARRLGCGRHGAVDIEAHDFFRGEDWAKMKSGEAEPPFTPPADALLDEATDRKTMTKWVREQMRLLGEQKCFVLGDEQQAVFGEWRLSADGDPQGAEEPRAMERFLTMSGSQAKEFVASASAQDVGALVTQIRDLKRQWLDENCKLALAQFAQSGLKVENERLAEQVAGLTDELTQAKANIQKLKQTLLESSGRPGGYNQNPLNSFHRSRSSSIDKVAF